MLQDLEYVASFGILGCFEGCAVGLYAKDLLFYFFFATEDIDEIAVRLTHFPPIGTWNDPRRCVDFRLRDDERFAVFGVESLSQVSGDFQVLLLVFSDRYLVCTVEENIGSHQDGIKEQSRIDVVELLFFILEGMRICQHRVRREATQMPAQFHHLREVGLAVEQVGFRIEPKRQPSGCGMQDVLLQGGAILNRRECVEVGNEKQRLCAFLLGHFDGGENGTQNIAQVRGSRALNTREYAAHFNEKGDLGYISNGEANIYAPKKCSSKSSE